MQRLACVGLSFVCVLAAFSPTRADLAPFGRSRPPRPIPQPEPVVVEKFTAPVVLKHGGELSQEKAVVAKISIPRALVKGQANPTKPNTREGGALGLEPRTLLAGIALSAAAVCGLMVMRGSRAAKLTTAGCLVAALVFGAWSLAGANAPLPHPPISDGKVVVEIVDGTDTVTIHLAK